MNKRISKKNLTEDEKMVLSLYHQCEKLEFVKYNEKNSNDALSFTNQLGISKTKKAGDTNWTESTKGKIRAIAFLK